MLMPAQLLITLMMIFLSSHPLSKYFHVLTVAIFFDGLILA